MDQTQFQTDPALTAIVREYHNPTYTLIAEQIMPTVTVPARQYKFVSYPVEQMFTVPDTRVGLRSQPNRVEMEGSLENAGVEDFGIDIPLDNPTIAEAERNGYDPRPRAAQRAKGIIDLDREVRTAALVQDSDNYAAENIDTLADTDQFSDYENSDPLGVFDDILSRPLIRPNQLVMGQVVWSKLRQHPQLVAARNANSGDKGVISREDLAELLELNRVIVGTSRVNIKRPGLAMELNRVWGNFIAAHFTDPTVTPEGGITWGYSGMHGNVISGEIPAKDMGIHGGVYVRSAESRKEHVISVHSGALILDPIDLTPPEE